MTSVRSRVARYLGADEEFFRREAGRTRGWLLRGGGATWLGVYAALLLVQSLLVVNVRPQTTGYGTITGVFWISLQYGWVFSLPVWFALAGWAYALHTRSMAPLMGERGGELFLTHLESRQLWPALLLAPMALRLAMAVIAAVAGLATFAYWLFTEGPPGEGHSPAMWMTYRVYGLLLGLALVAAQVGAATACAAAWIHPGGSGLRTAVRAAVIGFGFSQLDTMMILLSQAAMLGGFDRFFSPMLRDVYLPLPYHLAFLPGVAIRLGVFAWLAALGVRRLRSPAAMEAWRAALEG